MEPLDFDIVVNIDQHIHLEGFQLIAFGIILYIIIGTAIAKIMYVIDPPPVSSDENFLIGMTVILWPAVPVLLLFIGITSAIGKFVKGR